MAPSHHSASAARDSRINAAGCLAFITVTILAGLWFFLGAATWTSGHLVAALLLAAVLVITSVLPWLSHVYSEMALGLLTRRFPAGSIESEDLRIPVRNATGFLYPNWLGTGGYVSLGLQWAIVVPVWVMLGWRWSLAYAVGAIIAVSVGSILCEHSSLWLGLAAGIMIGHLRRRLQRRDFRWDSSTNAEGEIFFESLFRDVVSELEQAFNVEAKDRRH